MSCRRSVGRGRRPGGRSLNLIDIENLMGNPRGGRELIEVVQFAYQVAVPIRVHDHLVIACNPGLARNLIGTQFRGQLLVRGGPDGAEATLLAYAEPAHLSTRYDTVYIGSGDHIFAQLAADLRLRGVEVVVVSRRGSLSGLLQQVATRVVWLDEPPRQRAI